MMAGSGVFAAACEPLVAVFAAEFCVRAESTAANENSKTEAKIRNGNCHVRFKCHRPSRYSNGFCVLPTTFAANKKGPWPTLVLSRLYSYHHTMMGSSNASVGGSWVRSFAPAQY